MNLLGIFSVGIYLLKVFNESPRTIYYFCSKWTRETLERRHWRRSGVFVVNFEQISIIDLLFSLLALNKSGIFPSTFLQPVNGSKNSILNWVMKLNLFMFFFLFVFFKHPWKIFYFIHLFLMFALDTYKHA